MHITWERKIKWRTYMTRKLHDDIVAWWHSCMMTCFHDDSLEFMKFLSVWKFNKMMTELITMIIIYWHHDINVIKWLKFLSRWRYVWVPASIEPRMTKNEEKSATLKVLIVFYVYAAIERRKSMNSVSLFSILCILFYLIVISILLFQSFL